MLSRQNGDFQNGHLHQSNCLLSRFILSHSHRSPSLEGLVTWEGKSPLATCHHSSQGYALPSLSHGAPGSTLIQTHWHQHQALAGNTGLKSGLFWSLRFSMGKHNIVPGSNRFSVLTSFHTTVWKAQNTVALALE